MVTIGAIVLERARGVDDESGCEALQGVGDVAPVEREGNRARLTPETGAEGFGAGEVAAADQQFETGKISPQFGKPSAEAAIAAEHTDLHSHTIRSLYSGRGLQQFTILPKHRYRVRASSGMIRP